MTKLFLRLFKNYGKAYMLCLALFAFLSVSLLVFPVLRSGYGLWTICLLQVLLLGWLVASARYAVLLPLKLGSQLLENDKLLQSVEPRILALYQENKRLENEICRATDYIKALENPDKDISAIYADQDDSSELKKSLMGLWSHLQKLESEDKQRSWVAQGLARFVEILRSNAEDIDELSNRIITHLVKYLGATQGGIFVLNQDEEEPYLEMLSCYAYERKKHLQKRIEVGEGLLGQVILEKEYIHLTEIPEQYVNITSGLGQANPRVLLIFPLIINEEVMGAIELASFKPFEAFHIEFMKKLSENIAATLASAKSAQNNRRLLEESQQQTEEMRAQEEEMRQNMEELQATQEQQERLQAEIKANEEILRKKVKELEEARTQMEEIKTIEQQRAKEQIEKRNQMMVKVQEKFKSREQELLAQIQQLEAASANSAENQ
jgi:methyl-accepting chemotaxis protein